MSSSQAHDQKVLPLTHPVDVATIKPDGLVVNFEATESERAGLAKLFDIPAVVKLNASFKLTRKGSRVKVRGDVSGIVTRLCVLSVEPFDMDFHEAVSVDYDELREEDATEERDEEGPDPIIDGEIDLGALAAEFTALSLDPYPKKPGVVFNYQEDDEDKPPSPFAKLAAIKSKS
jgi:uncharacterized metal-binding protein YceD (DUF177 family)